MNYEGPKEFGVIKTWREAGLILLVVCVVFGGAFLLVHVSDPSIDDEHLQIVHAVYTSREIRDSIDFVSSAKIVLKPNRSFFQRPSLDWTRHRHDGIVDGTALVSALGTKEGDFVRVDYRYDVDAHTFTVKSIKEEFGPSVLDRVSDKTASSPPPATSPAVQPKVPVPVGSDR